MYVLVDWDSVFVGLKWYMKKEEKSRYDCLFWVVVELCSYELNRLFSHWASTFREWMIEFVRKEVDWRVQGTQWYCVCLVVEEWNEWK